MRKLLVLAGILWASPWTAFGLLLGGLTLAGGGTARRRGRALEFSGRFVGWFLRTFTRVPGAEAVTFGHVVLGRDVQSLDACRAHETVHVHQYERWGPLFVPAYVYYWVRLRLAGRDSYWDNPFEQAARRESGEEQSS